MLDTELIVIVAVCAHFNVTVNFLLWKSLYCCREVVEETYNTLQAQIERIRSEHMTNMTTMATDTSDSQQLYIEMYDKVKGL